MTGKIAAYALPLGLFISFLAPNRSFAATPIATFGVSATVQASCSAAASMFHGSYSAAQSHAASSVSVNCNNDANYRIALSVAISTAASLPSGRLAFPLRPVAAANDTVGIGSFQPIIAYSDPLGAPFGEISPSSDAVSVTITY